MVFPAKTYRGVTEALPFLISNTNKCLGLEKNQADFINMKDNHRLDELEYSGVKGFTVVAKVSSGFETIQKFYADYGPKPATQQDSIYTYGNKFLRKNYPDLDYIIKATIIN